MVSSVGIANIALSKLGAKPIVSIEENTAIASKVRVHYDECRRMTISRGPWNCCIVRTTLVASGDSPAHTYTHKYVLPNNPSCIRVLTLQSSNTTSGSVRTTRSGRFPGSDPAYEYEIEANRYLMTDNSSPINIVYLADITDPGGYTPGLVRVMACDLAVQLCESVTGDRALKENLQQEARAELMSARAINAIEGYPEMNASFARLFRYS